MFLNDLGYFVADSTRIMIEDRRQKKEEKEFLKHCEEIDKYLNSPKYKNTLKVYNGILIATAVVGGVYVVGKYIKEKRQFRKDLEAEYGKVNGDMVDDFLNL